MLDWKKEKGEKEGYKNPKTEGNNITKQQLKLILWNSLSLYQGQYPPIYVNPK